MDHRQIDKAFRNRRTLLKVFAQTPKTVEPTECALDNPTFRVHLKALGTASVGDKRLHTKELLTPIQERWTGIAAVENEQLQALKQWQAFEQPAPCDPVLLVGRMHQHAQQPALRIDRYLSFTPF